MRDIFPGAKKRAKKKAERVSDEEELIKELGLIKEKFDLWEMFFSDECKQFKPVILKRIMEIGFDYHDGDCLYNILDLEESIVDSFMDVASYNQLTCAVIKKKPHISEKSFERLKLRYSAGNIQIPDYRDFLISQLNSGFSSEAFSILNTMILSISNIAELSETSCSDEIKKACWEIKKQREEETQERTKNALDIIRRLEEREQ